MNQKLKTNYSTRTKMLGARVPLPLVARVENVVSRVGNISQTEFIVSALAAAVDRHECEMSGAGARSELVLQ